MNSRLLAILAVVLLAICGGAVWFLNSQPDAPVAAVPEVVKATPEPVKEKAITVVRPSAKETTPKVDSSEPLAPVKDPEPAPPLAEWEVKIDQVLRANAEVGQTAQMLINMLPTLPKEGQTEAAQHISNLVEDKDYNRLLPLVKNTGLSEEVLSVFVTDLMNRPDTVKLPVLLDIAKLPNHPNHEEAVTDLQIFLDADFGTDWTQWQTAMQSYLKRQAAENAAADAAAPVQ